MAGVSWVQTLRLLRVGLPQTLSTLFRPLMCRHSFHKKTRNSSYRNDSKHPD